MRVTQVGFWTTCMLAMLAASPNLQAQQDPGPRSGVDAGGRLPGLSEEQKELFDLGLEEFTGSEGVGDGLGPRFNLDGCGGCHAHPAVGGTAPAVNPQVALATAGGADNKVPQFITRNGPIREVRSTIDGKVHALYVISGRRDDTGDARKCPLHQENFFDTTHLRFRIPTPLFGAGLIEKIEDRAILDNKEKNSQDKQQLGIRGKVQTQAISSKRLGRFGWKAQHASLENFSGEAYNVEMGITNELSPIEIGDPRGQCQYAEEVPNSLPPLPEDGGGPSDVELFTAFMQGLAGPQASRNTPGGADSIARGKAVFSEVGCALCHTPTLDRVPLYSNLLLHHMGTKLKDDIRQGDAGSDEFRTAPLWGVGQRIFFLHDGRTTDLMEAIQAHRSRGSEANQVIDNFNDLSKKEIQDLLNFLRSL